MTMDRSLKNRGGLKGSRSVMTRAERIALMLEDEKFDPKTSSPFGLPKMRARVGAVAGKVVIEDETTDDASASE